ncbi:hypothetical protein B0H15DRAFT_955344 [Mycena belliarum]|uniref:Uncharacterized protein n=1 Tax=Mycena belliarum TaxID=1033014 RepID=A0AAD6XGC8_9AGAR|nr:hypothetical protein B0H15DRAFT_955344 [Mycena belliae]
MPSLPAPAASPFADSQHKYNVFARLKQFTAIAAVLDAHGWSNEGGAKVLLERALPDAGPDGPAPQFAFLVAVGRYNNELQKAKYSFIVEDPIDDPVWHGAWAQSVLHLKVFEGDVCSGPTTNFIINEDNNDVALRFTKPVFEAKGENPPEVDTAKWPVGGSNADRLKETCITHDARPFPLYDVNELLVPMHQVERVLPGCLVAVTFRLISHSFVRDGRNVDSMTAEVQQVEILKKGRPRPKTPFAGKRGLFRPVASLDSNGQLPPAPSGQRFNRRQFPMTPAHALTQHAAQQAPQTDFAPPVPAFASHLNPESSPFGSHSFQFAPTSPNSVAANATPDGDGPGIAQLDSGGAPAPVSAPAVPEGLVSRFGLPTTSLLPSPASLETAGHRATSSRCFLPDGDVAVPSSGDPNVMWSGSFFNSPNQLSMQSPDAHGRQYHGPDDMSRFIREDGGEDEVGADDNTFNQGPSDSGTPVVDPASASPVPTGRRTVKRVRNTDGDGGQTSKRARAVAA